jgi:hypothetical protein
VGSRVSQLYKYISKTSSISMTNYEKISLCSIFPSLVIKVLFVFSDE